MLAMARGEGAGRPSYAARMSYRGLLARDGLVPIDQDWTRLYRDDEVDWLAQPGAARQGRVSAMAMRIGTSEQDGTFHSQGRALKAIFDRRPSLAPVEVLHVEFRQHRERQPPCTRARSSSASWPRTGSAAPRTASRRSAQPIDIRMAAPMNAGPLFFIVRADAPIRTVADLRGRRVAVGMATSGMVQHAHTIFGVLGLSFADFTPVYLDFAAGADALAAGEVDAQFQCPIPNKVMSELAERVAVRVLPYAPGELAALVKAVPYYRADVMRKGAFRGLDAGRGAGRGRQHSRHACARARGRGARGGRGDRGEHGRARPAQSAVSRPGGFVRAAAHARVRRRSSSAASRCIPARSRPIARPDC